MAFPDLEIMTDPYNPYMSAERGTVSFPLFFHFLLLISVPLLVYLSRSRFKRLVVWVPMTFQQLSKACFVT